MSTVDVARELRAVLESIGQLRGTLTNLISSVSTGRARLGAVVHGSRHNLVVRMLATSAAAIERLREADLALNGTAVSIMEYGSAIGVNLGSATTPAHADTSGQPDIDIPDAVLRLADRLAPWRSGEDTIGYAYDAEHPHRDGHRFVSGRMASASAGLVGRYRLVRTFTDHIEGHVAARMRSPGGPRHVVLVENNQPCGYAAGCDRLLRDILPTGSTLTIYVKDCNGVRMHDVYLGNGRGVTA